MESLTATSTITISPDADRPQNQSSRQRRRSRATWVLTPAVARYHRPRLNIAAWAPILIFFVTFCTVGAAARPPPPAAPAAAPPAPAPAPAAASPPAATATVSGTATNAHVAVDASNLSPTPLPPPPPAETLLVDDRVPILFEGRWTMVPKQELELGEMRRRDESEPNDDAPLTTTTTISIPRSSPSTTEEAASATSTTAPASPLPSPFDMNMASSNFTEKACPAFLNSMLANPTFRECYPLSMLLQGSASMFVAEKSLVATTQVLDASCAADVTFCGPFLSSMAKNLTSPDACGPDFQLGNSVVVQAQLGLVSYPTVYAATCLRDPDTNSYCFANAVTNTTTSANAYVYYLPVNNSLPATAVPACSWCLQNTMAIYHASAANRRQPVASTYQPAARVVNTICGPDFVNETLPAALLLNGGSALRPGGPSWVMLLLSVVVACAVHFGF